ncbi:MAG: MBL fold metallo-hydrolase [Planctomycetota bacterium]|jgi:glyoxylase-like metal-dependent hydrolase (beta-lactamase superfamily II)
MILENLVVSPFATNCFILGCEQTKDCVVIDPGDDSPSILARTGDLGLTVKKILLTHGHVDNIAATGDLKAATGADMLLHKEDEFLLAASQQQAAMFGWSISTPVPAPDATLDEGSKIAVGEVELTVLHTPGHSPGSVSLLAGDRVFVGDLVFAGSVGRTDLPGGSGQTLLKSVKDKILPLDDKLHIYCGHGPDTTVGEERATNPFLQDDAAGLFF